MSTTITNLPETSKVNGSDYLVLDQPDKTVKSTVSNFLTDTGVVLATQLKDTDGADLIQTSNGNTVQEELNNNLLNDREQWRRSLAEAGLTLVDGSFEEGATANSKTDAVWHISGGQCYVWDGELPKDIPAGSNPVEDANWKPLTDQLLRQNLSSNTGFALIGQVESFAALRNINPVYAGQRILLKSYYEGGTTGGGEFEAVYGSAVDDAGGIEGNYVGSFNVPAIGSITQNFTTGIPYIYTPTGWKSLTAAS